MPAISRGGGRVVAIDQSDEIANAIGYFLAFPSIDLTNRENMDDLKARLAELNTRFSGIVNVAGGFVWELIDGGDLRGWDRMFAMNLTTALIATDALLPYLDRGAAIVNIGAMAASRGASGMGAYAASKSAVARFTESLAEELKERVIRVNAVLPSLIDTPANRASIPDADFEKWVSPEEVADAVLFLLSHRARGVTGALLQVAGRM